MKINMMLTADAEAQRARRLISVGTVFTGHVAAAGFPSNGVGGSGLVVRTRPWMPVLANAADASRKSAFGASLSISQIAQPSTAAASGLCASNKQYQEKARGAAATGGAKGPLPPRDPV